MRIDQFAWSDLLSTVVPAVLTYFLGLFTGKRRK